MDETYTSIPQAICLFPPLSMMIKKLLQQIMKKHFNNNHLTTGEEYSVLHLISTLIQMLSGTECFGHDNPLVEIFQQN